MFRSFRVVTTAFLLVATHFSATVLAEVVTIDGTLKTVDAKKRTISIETEGKTKDFDVSSKAKINVNGKEVPLGSLEVGQQVKLSYHDELDVVLKIESISSEGETRQNGETSLFDSKTLKGWHGDTKLWKVKDGVIVGKNTSKLKSNTFLVSDRQYDDFVLRLKFRLVEGNSGVQIRSGEKATWVVGGPQADIADFPHLGCLTGEGIQPSVFAKTTDETKEELKKSIDLTKWNDMTITAEGQSVVITINGITTVNVIADEIPKSGVIAFQIHGGAKTHVEFKDIVIAPVP